MHQTNKQNTMFLEEIKDVESMGKVPGCENQCSKTTNFPKNNL